MADNINVSERNTFPVLYNINVSTVILPPRQHYIYIYFRNMKPYNERKMKTIIIVTVLVQRYKVRFVH